MKPKPQPSKPAVSSGMGTTGDSDDDPMGMIPSSGSGGAKPQNEVLIKSGQFETKTHEIETQYEPPEVEN